MDAIRYLDADTILDYGHQRGERKPAVWLSSHR